MMLISYSEVPKARRRKLLLYYRVQRHKVVSMNICVMLGGGTMSSGYRCLVGRAVYGCAVYRVICIQLNMPKIHKTIIHQYQIAR